MVYIRSSIRSMSYPMLVLTLVLGLVLAACGGQQNTSGATSSGSGTNNSGDKTTAPAATSAHKTSSGFVCPEPKTKMAVTSKALNLFVWAEYIPQDIIDCFQMIYGQAQVEGSVFFVSPVTQSLPLGLVPARDLFKPERVYAEPLKVSQVSGFLGYG